MIPPNRKFAKYQPLMEAFRGTLWVTPLRLNSTTYLAGWKYPSEELSVIVAGVTPVLMAIPLAFLSVKLAPGGLLEMVTGYEDLLTILAQAVIQRQVPPIVNLAMGPRMSARSDGDWVMVLFMDDHHSTNDQTPSVLGQKSGSMKAVDDTGLT